MKPIKHLITALLIVHWLGLYISSAQEGDNQKPLSVAVLNFEESDDSVKGNGKKISYLLSAFMSTNDKVIMVERAGLEKSLNEFELSLSGNISNASAAKIGQIAGAKVLVLGRIFPVGKKTYIVAKIIGVETSRVFGETVKFGSEDELEDTIKGLSEKISDIIAKQASTLTSVVETPEQRIARLKKLIGEKGNGKKVYVSITEEHISRRIPDPAVQTTIQLTFQSIGFGLTKKIAEADIRIVGEAFSERASQRGQLISCRGRAEIERLDKDGNLVSVNRQTEVAIDLAENIAAKAALDNVGQVLAERLIAELAAE